MFRIFSIFVWARKIKSRRIFSVKIEKLRTVKGLFEKKTLLRFTKLNKKSSGTLLMRLFWKSSDSIFFKQANTFDCKIENSFEPNARNIKFFVVLNKPDSMDLNLLPNRSKLIKFLLLLNNISSRCVSWFWDKLRPMRFKSFEKMLMGSEAILLSH